MFKDNALDYVNTRAVQLYGKGTTVRFRSNAASGGLGVGQWWVVDKTNSLRAAAPTLEELYEKIAPTNPAAQEVPVAPVKQTLLTVEEVARILKVTPSGVRKFISARGLRATKVARPGCQKKKDTLVALGDLDTWKSKNAVRNFKKVLARMGVAGSTKAPSAPASHGSGSTCRVTLNGQVGARLLALEALGVDVDALVSKAVVSTLDKIVAGLG